MPSSVLITGVTSGIGRAAAIRFAQIGFRVIGTGRSSRNARSLQSRLNAFPEPVSGRHRIVVCDQSSLSAVRNLAQRVVAERIPLHALVANAGIQPQKRSVTGDGIESTIAVNHLAHFVLARELAPALREASGRIIVTSSSSHPDGRLDSDDLELSRGWTPEGAYGRSKRANIMFAADVRGRLGLPASAFHPGDIRTSINREAPFVRLTKPLEFVKYAHPSRGVDTLEWLVTTAEGAAPSAAYYADRAPAETHPDVSDESKRAWLWDESARLVDGVLE